MIRFFEAKYFDFICWFLEFAQITHALVDLKDGVDGKDWASSNELTGFKPIKIGKPLCYSWFRG